MIDYSEFLGYVQNSTFKRHTAEFEQICKTGITQARYGDLPQWEAALNALPAVRASDFDIKQGCRIGRPSDITSAEQATITAALKTMMPWRKGPYRVFGIEIDTEWRSDWKWDRLLPHIKPLDNRLVLDVGCGNGYHMWRMLGENAKRVIGVDPSPRFIYQFYMLKKLLHQIPMDILPCGLEHLPDNLQKFDTTFCMGVFYHRRSPFDHLKQLKQTLKSGGQLILETLVVDGPEGHVLVPEKRYAQMNNVWFLPSVPTLIQWMKKMGFQNPRCVDTNTTSLEEQRATAWMQYQSLEDFLDPNDLSKTIEGYPAPQRAIIIADTP